MPTQKKIDAVEALRERIERATISLSIGYRGLTVREMEALRRQLRTAEAEVKVVKNNLLALAAEKVGAQNLISVVEGPTAIAFAYGEPLAAAKALTEHARSGPKALSVQGGYMDGAALTADDINELAEMPPKPVMIGQISGQIMSPMTSLIGMLETSKRDLIFLMESVLSQLPSLVEARARQLESPQES